MVTDKQEGIAPTTTDVRAAMIQGLRQLADFLDATPAVEATIQTYNVYVTTREELAAVARTGSWEKIYAGDYFVLRKTFSGGVQLDVYTDRARVCRRVVTGSRVVTAPPATEEYTEEIVEWVCEDAVLLGA